MFKFEKVSLGQFCYDFRKLLPQEQLMEFTDQEAENIYEDLRLPERATEKSAGYDFFSPVGFELKPGETIVIPTGIRVLMPGDKVLVLAPRSGLGCKFRMQFDNTVGIIDADYSDAANQGHIMMSITNDSNKGKTLSVKAGQAIAQGIFLQYFKVDDDNVKTKRNGGFGSTDSKKDTKFPISPTIYEELTGYKTNEPTYLEYNQNVLNTPVINGMNTQLLASNDSVISTTTGTNTSAINC